MLLDQNKSFIFEDSDIVIKFWNCADDNLFLPYKIQLSL